MEATIASEATKMAIPGNMHIDARVIEAAYFKYVVKFDLKGHCVHMEVTLASEAA